MNEKIRIASVIQVYRKINQSLGDPTVTSSQIRNQVSDQVYYAVGHNKQQICITVENQVRNQINGQIENKQ